MNCLVMTLPLNTSSLSFITFIPENVLFSQNPSAMQRKLTGEQRSGNMALCTTNECLRTLTTFPQIIVN
jgi:hypothetical protein